jgi:hypothetical protein
LFLLAICTFCFENFLFNSFVLLFIGLSNSPNFDHS